MAKKAKQGELKLPELKWLKGTEVLFAPGPDYGFNVTPTIADDLSFYALGYREAAESLFAHLDAKRHNVADWYLFPLAFMWRQYLELTLKSLATLGERLTGENWEVDQNHNLGALWPRVRALAEKWWPDHNEGQWASKLIEEFHRIDPGSIGFRYPRKRDGKPSLGDAPPTINIRVFHDSMVRLANLLDGTHDAWGDALDAIPRDY